MVLRIVAALVIVLSIAGLVIAAAKAFARSALAPDGKSNAEPDADGFRAPEEHSQEASSRPEEAGRRNDP